LLRVEEYVVDASSGPGGFPDWLLWLTC